MNLNKPLTVETADLMPIEQILRHLHSDKAAYQETIDNIANNDNYFTHDNNYEHRYWSDWFNGCDMKQYN